MSDAQDELCNQCRCELTRQRDELKARMQVAVEALRYVEHHLKHGGLYGPWREWAKQRVRAALTSATSEPITLLGMPVRVDPTMPPGTFRLEQTEPTKRDECPSHCIGCERDVCVTGQGCHKRAPSAQKPVPFLTIGLSIRAKPVPDPLQGPEAAEARDYVKLTGGER